MQAPLQTGFFLTIEGIRYPPASFPADVPDFPHQC